MTTPVWQAAMIAADEDLDGAPLLRHAVVLDEGHGAVASAVLHLTALGVVSATIGGFPVSDELLAPGWTSYEWRLRYRSHDVGALLAAPGAPGATPVEIVLALGNGWWRGRVGFTGARAVYGDELAALAQLEITYTDGHVQVVGTDDTWTASPSTTTANDLYDGQTIDARRAAAAGAPGSTGVHVVPFDTDLLAPAVSPPVRRQEVVRPVRVWASPSGRTLVDFGVNLVGWVRFEVQGPAGRVVTVRHAEVLEHDELGVRPLRTALATDRLVLSGGVDRFEPTLTTHGFRYAEITGWPGEPTVDDLEAVWVHTDLRRTGHFACSEPLLNRLHANVVRSLRGNAVGVPTDCPQRDERLGWTGDLAVFAPTAAYLFDVADFLGDWLVDVALEQEHAGGRVPLMAPDPMKRLPPPPGLPPIDVAAIWGDAAVWVPWTLWEAYGDDAVLRAQWPSMRAHVERVTGLLSERGLWETGFQFGDWLDPGAPPDQPFRSRADNGVVATACFHRTLVTASHAAEVLGLASEAERLDALAERVRSAFLEHYVTVDGDGGTTDGGGACRVLSDCPTVYALALEFGLLDGSPALVQGAGDRLAELVAADGFRVGTGFAGTPYVTAALTRTGHLDAAYRLLLQTECPSWLYPVTMGATTIWERWDSLLPDGSVNPGEMTSFNHYALGAVADWLHRTVGGLAPLEPGYARVLVAPRPGGGLTWAETSLETRHGLVRVAWEATRAGALTRLGVTVPEGVVAVVRLDDGVDVELAAGQHTIEP